MSIERWLPIIGYEGHYEVSDHGRVRSLYARNTREPAFDMERLGDLLDRYGITPGWHYHPCDVPTMAVGWLAGQGRPMRRPWKSDAVSAACDIDPADYERHTAMGDVEWTWDLFVRIGGTW